MYKTFVVGIAGASASGKTSFTKQLERELKKSLGDDAVDKIDCDGYYVDLPAGMSGEDFNWDDPNNFDVIGLCNDIKSLCQGNIIKAPIHDYKNYQKIPNALEVKPCRVLIIENLFTLTWKEIIPLLDFKIYIDCDEVLTFSRRIIRDSQERGYKLELIVERYEQFVKPAYHRYIYPSRKEATVIIPNYVNNGDKQLDENRITVVKNHILMELYK